MSNNIEMESYDKKMNSPSRKRFEADQLAALAEIRTAAILMGIVYSLAFITKKKRQKYTIIVIVLMIFLLNIFSLVSLYINKFQGNILILGDLIPLGYGIVLAAFNIVMVIALIYFAN